MSFPFGTDINHPLRKLYDARKKDNDMYPGFSQFTETGIRLGEILVPTNVRDVKRPSDEAPCSYSNLVEGDKVTIFNRFSPSIYKAALVPHKNLKLLDSFFIGIQGERIEKWGNGITHAAAIIRKS